MSWGMVIFWKLGEMNLAAALMSLVPLVEGIVAVEVPFLFGVGREAFDRLRDGDGGCGGRVDRVVVVFGRLGLGLVAVGDRGRVTHGGGGVAGRDGLAVGAGGEAFADGDADAVALASAGGGGAGPVARRRRALRLPLPFVAGPSGGAVASEGTAGRGGCAINLGQGGGGTIRSAPVGGAHVVAPAWGSELLGSVSGPARRPRASTALAGVGASVDDRWDEWDEAGRLRRSRVGFAG